MRRSSKRLKVSGETIRSLSAALATVRGGVETGPTNSGDANCPTTAGYPSCGSCVPCGGGGDDTNSCYTHRIGPSCYPGGC